MIDHENLRTASLYINNQLLSRGLLRDGHSIDFACPGDAEGEVSKTMGRIMGVVNDLILRRDRDAEHRESLSTTLRALRAESLRQANDIQRLYEMHAEAQRRVGLGEAAEAAARAQLRTAEAAVHRLREDAARARTLVAQTRASCANEVRKRDRQIEALKKAVADAGRARGAGRATGITSITVIGDVGSDAELGKQVHGELTAGDLNGAGAAAGADLRAETNAFLAELSKKLSDENEGLLQLIRKTTAQLKDMSGWTDGAGDGHALALAANPADMAREVDAVLEHLRTILTNPSFVPIEEVVVREDEIHRLRDGWEKMQSRWKEAVHLMDGWRRRMQASGRPVNVEELRMGLRLSPVKVRNVEETSHGYALQLQLGSGVDEREGGGDDDDDGHHAAPSYTPCDEGPGDLVGEQHGDDPADDSDASSMFDHDVDVDELDVEEPNVEVLHQSFVMPPPPPLPLCETRSSVNRTSRPDHHKRHSQLFPPISEEKTYELAGEEPPLPPPHAELPQKSPQKRPVLMVRPVPPEEAATVALPPSAALSTPDTWVSSVPLEAPGDSRPEETLEPAKPEPRQATAAKRREEARDLAKKKDVPPTRREATTRNKNADGVKPAPRSPAKARPTRAAVTRGRPETRPDEKPARASKAPPQRPPSAASASSARSTAGVAGGENKPANAAAAATTTNTTTAAAAASPTRRPVPSPAPSPKRRRAASPGPRAANASPQRVNSRLPLPRTGAVNANNINNNNNNNNNNNSLLPPPQQSPVNMAAIAAKLAASEGEADAARVRAKLRAARLGGVGGGGGKAGVAAGVSTSTTRSNESDSVGAGSTATATTTSSSSASLSSSSSDAASGSVTTVASTGTATTEATTAPPRENGCNEVEGSVDDDHSDDADDVDELGLSPPPQQQEPQQQQQQQPQQQTQQEQQKQPKQPRKRAAPQQTVDAPTTTKKTSSNAAPATRKRERRASKAAGASAGTTTSSSSRRRSTLSPWELDALIHGGTVTVQR